MFPLIFSKKQTYFTRTCRLILCFILCVCLLLSAVSCSGKPNIKNVILMISDGTSVGVSTLTRWCESYNANDGSFNTDFRLNMDDYASGLVRTYWKDGDGTLGAITDSAPAATAFSTGHKSQDKFIGIGFDEKSHATVLELAESIGKSTGLVATANVQHATPGAFAAHTTNRADYEGIASQMLDSGADVVLGGGSQYLQNRADGKNLIDELQKKGYDYVTSADELSNFDGTKLYGLFAPDAMAYDIDRPILAPTEPTLAEMTQKAIDTLSKNDKGFFLMVEGSKVDWGGHSNDPVAMVSEFRAFDQAVKSAIDFAKSRNDTMVLIVEDHGTGGISIGSEVSNKNYSSYKLEDIIAPLTSASITSFGAGQLLAEGKSVEEVLSLLGVSDPSEDDAEKLTSMQTNSEQVESETAVYIANMLSTRSNIGWTTTGHTGEDVMLYSYLPDNERITGLLENTEITQAICDAWGAKLDDSVCAHK